MIQVWSIVGIAIVVGAYIVFTVVGGNALRRGDRREFLNAGVTAVIVMVMVIVIGVFLATGGGTSLVGNLFTT